MVKDQLLRVFPVEGVGSGVIIDKKGYILTNNRSLKRPTN
jgi:S1-C subfamily serine protease